MDINYDDVCTHLEGMLKIAKTLGIEGNDALNLAYTGVNNVTSVNLGTLLTINQQYVPEEKVVMPVGTLSTKDVSVKLGYGSVIKINKYLAHIGFIKPHPYCKNYHYTQTELAKPYSVNFQPDEPKNTLYWTPEILSMFPVDGIPILPRLYTYVTEEDTNGTETSDS